MRGIAKKVAGRFTDQMNIVNDQVADAYDRISKNHRRAFNEIRWQFRDFLADPRWEMEIDPKMPGTGTFHIIIEEEGRKGGGQYIIEVNGRPTERATTETVGKVLVETVDNLLAGKKYAGLMKGDQKSYIEESSVQRILTLSLDLKMPSNGETIPGLLSTVKKAHKALEDRRKKIRSDINDMDLRGINDIGFPLSFADAKRDGITMSVSMHIRHDRDAADIPRLDTALLFLTDKYWVSP